MVSSTCSSQDNASNPWPYCPSIAAAVILALLFLGTTVAHIYQAVRHRQLFCLVVIIGALMETAAFAFRFSSAKNPSQKGAYDASFLLNLLAPIFVNAFDYMIISRLVRCFLRKTKVFGLGGNIMGKIFVCCDIISFIIQIGGGLMTLSKTPSSAKTGIHIVTFGVVFQEVLIVFFFALTVRLTQKLDWVMPHSRISKDVKLRIHGVQISLALITYRIVYRIVQFSSGQGSSINTYINKHEWCEYVFDGVPMFFALVVMNVFHPGQVLSAENPDGFALPLNEY
ncbi:uncharacterized protein Z520_06088 [Fonsecaea multimorphosa CBS 102226]|uniref:RTA1 domain protein n=1 Tax=Fonsecaea multimorphosa CBS 102226 TaxID=1442371 RepID=A0A0D2K4A7_9EURO|nr:uncharacterized protein Z520_06088 [Fonsecaea multimorphosa CBS 102226]KIX98009.1 hypothetical protein Z520_06088 [Fonsecaea multimorphosa CBS 102226]OAL24378.1 hypothetical protein AYO22_05754 [Fonsecaea multimorphosa]